LESQADSLPDGQDYKPEQKHFVNIFSAQAHGRFNSRPIKPEISAKIVVSAGEELLDGGELADTGAEPFGGDGGSEQHDRGENDDEGEPGAARGFGCRRGGKERADGESHDNPSDVGGVADAGDGRAEDQIVSDEGTEAAEHFAINLEMRGGLLQIDERNEHAGEPEDGAGGASPCGERMPINAGDAAEDAADEVGEKIGEAAEEALGRAAKIPEAPHIEAEVNQAEVDEHAGDEAPPLAVKRERSKISAERDGLLRSGIEGGDSAEHHDGEHQNACSDESDGNGERSGRECISGRGQRGGSGLRELLDAVGAMKGRGRIAVVAFEFLAAGGTALDGHGREMVTGFLGGEKGGGREAES